MNFWLGLVAYQVVWFAAVSGASRGSAWPGVLGMLIYAAVQLALAKRYRVELARPLKGDEAKVFGDGGLMLESDDKPLLPAEFEPISDRSGFLTLHEGRYHQVRRMFAAIGNHVEALHRDRIGGLDLPQDLAAGEWRPMGEADVAQLFGQAVSPGEAA